MRKFVKTEKYGTLYVDRILFESYYPVLFSCKNDRNDVFIAVCCQNNAQGIKWMVGKTTPLAIVKMLRDEITIRELITMYTSEKFSIDYKDRKYDCKYEPKEWEKDSVYLPKKDSYIMAEPGEFDDDIEYFTNVEGKIQYASQSEYYPLVNKTESLSGSPSISVGESASLIISPDRGTIIAGEIIRTVQTPWEIQSKTFINLPQYSVAQIEKGSNTYCISGNFETVADGCFSHTDFETVNIELKKDSEYNLPNAV